MRSSSVWTGILVPLDGSSVADRALSYAERLAQAAGAEFFLLHVGERQEFIDSAIAELTQRGIPAKAIQVDGQPGTTIPSVASNIRADIIVMASHGRTGLRRLLFGNVTGSVLHKATVPVLVLGPASVDQHEVGGQNRTANVVMTSIEASHSRGAGLNTDNKE